MYMGYCILPQVAPLAHQSYTRNISFSGIAEQLKPLNPHNLAVKAFIGKIMLSPCLTASEEGPQDD
jgi:hypothetical protein